MQTEQLANALIARQPGILDKTKLQKLLYYVNAWHLAITGEPLVNHRFKAWKQGPVLGSVWKNREHVETRDPRHVVAPELDDFTSRLIDMVLEQYGHLGSGTLSEMTHLERPWLAARGALPLEASSQEVIDPSIIAQHYRAEHELCGYAASELAVLGLPHADEGTDSEVEVRESTGIEHMPEDEWGGANLFVVPRTGRR